MPSRSLRRWSKIICDGPAVTGMAGASRPRRSFLYVPGTNARALEKAHSLPTDGLILDLEDSIAPDAKPAARAQVAQALAQGGFGLREVLVRVNGHDTPWHAEDMAILDGAHGVVLPKVDAAAIVQRAETSLAGHDLTIWCTIETPLGVLRAAEIAAASPRIAGLIMGTSDLTADLQARHVPDRRPLLTALSLCVLAARAHGLAAIDGVHLDLRDEAGFQAACEQARDLGFDGKSLIHPKTIAAANAAFGPDAGEVAQARRIIEAFAKAKSDGQGVTLLDGMLIEALHVAAAQRTLAIVEAIAVRETEG